MSKARLLADLMRDSKISLAEVSGEASSADFNVNEPDYLTADVSNDLKIEALEDENLLNLGV
tara:strand:- start:3564 stop:3749 length:186 start_codon:yes stop_codon:yes gene_type:complete